MTAEPTFPPVAAGDASDFRPIQYLGSKWRLLDEIERITATVTPTRRPAVCDLFTGTGVVAARLARNRPVVASDVQEYARVLASALLRRSRLDIDDTVNSARQAFRALESHSIAALFNFEAQCLSGYPESAAILCDFLEYGSIETGAWASSASSLGRLLPEAAATLSAVPYSAIMRHYGGVYFSYRQAAQLDAITTTVHAMPAEVKDTSIAALLSTASELVSSVGGHFAQPIRPRTANGRVKPGVISAIARSRRIDTFEVFEKWLHRYVNRSPSLHSSTALRADYRDTLSTLPVNVGCVYADPPYTRDHYSRFYHVLETLALGDDPGLSTMVLRGRTLPSRGLYRKERHQSPFSIVSRAPAAFEAMFALVAEREAALVLSYSPIPETEKPRARVTTLDVLSELAGKHFRTVEIRAIDTIAHAKLNAQRLNAIRTYDAEALLIARP